MMGTALETFLVSNVFAFIIVFVRMGTALMLIPGIGDSFVSERVRLHVTVALSFVLYPLLLPYIPNPLPQTFAQ